MTMAAKSTIEWTDASWTPIKARDLATGKTGWHCEKVSPGCAHCYSETFNGRRLPNGGTGFFPNEVHSFWTAGNKSDVLSEARRTIHEREMAQDAGAFR